MAKITRKTQKIFGGNSSSNAQYGSAREGTFVLDNDPDVIQALPAWESGINAATISGEKLPALEESQGVHYVETRQIAYILQEGIPEYDADTEYHENSIVKETGTVKLYRSLIDDNSDNPLSDSLSWKFLTDLDQISPLDNYTATTDPTVNDDSGDGYSVGSKWYNTVAQEAYLCVNSSVGAAIWILITLTADDLGTLAFLNTAPVANGGTNITSYTAGDTLYASGTTTLSKLPIGSSGRPYVSTGSAPSWGNAINLQAAVATTSGASVSISNVIPSGVRRVIVNVTALSINGGASPQLTLQLGPSGGLQTSGYTGGVSSMSATVATQNLSSGFDLCILAAHTSAMVLRGSITFTLSDSSTNTWVGIGAFGRSDTTNNSYVVGSVSLSGALSQISILAGGSANFDAGSASISWEF